jgi:DNA-binding NarL/FixJ family response regulator
MGEVVRVFVADDHAPFRRALIRMLSLAPGLELVGEASNGLDARDLCLTLEPDVAILDLMMPQMDGAEVTRAVKKKRPSTKVVILSVFGQEHHIRRGLAAGADRYLTKGLSSEELIAAVRAVADEGTLTGRSSGGM